MGAVTVDKLEPEVAKELSDDELKSIAGGDDRGNAKVARAALAERDATYGTQTGPDVSSMSVADLEAEVEDETVGSERFEQVTAELDARKAAPAKSAEVRGEAGQPVGDMPKDAPADPLPDVDEIRIDGTAQLSAFNLGGKLPTGSSLALTGGKVALVDGQAFHKGDRVKLTIEAVVNTVAQKDAHDPKTGQVVSCEQQHKARIVDVQLDSAS